MVFTYFFHNDIVKMFTLFPLDPDLVSLLPIHVRTR